MAITLYLCSLALPGIVLKSQQGDQGIKQLYGYDIVTFTAISGFAHNTGSFPITTRIEMSATVLLLGPVFLIFAGLGGLAWYANVFFALTLINIKMINKKISVVLSVIAVLLGLFAFAYSGIRDPESGYLTDFLPDHLAIGYYVWELALLMLAIYCIVRYVQFNNKTNISNTVSH